MIKLLERQLGNGSSNLATASFPPQLSPGDLPLPCTKQWKFFSMLAVPSSLSGVQRLSPLWRIMPKKLPQARHVVGIAHTLLGQEETRNEWGTASMRECTAH